MTKMKALVTASMLLVSSAAFAMTEIDPIGPADTPKLVLEKQPFNMSFPLKKKKPQSVPIKKNAAYIYTWQDDRGDWWESEVVASGRFTSSCSGTIYEVIGEDFSLFVQPKELKRIHSQ